MKPVYSIIDETTRPRQNTARDIIKFYESAGPSNVDNVADSSKFRKAFLAASATATLSENIVPNPPKCTLSIEERAKALLLINNNNYMITTAYVEVELARAYITGDVENVDKTKKLLDTLNTMQAVVVTPNPIDNLKI